MSLMKHLINQMVDELSGAKEYASLALEYKEDKDVSSMYSSMAKQELVHYNSLNSQIRKCLDKAKNEEDERYPGFEQVYNWMIGDGVREVAEVNTILDMVNK